jgi:hypothetical protein
MTSHKLAQSVGLDDICANGDEMDLHVIEGMARAFWVCAWADREEEVGRTYPGQDIDDAAPETPLVAKLEAARFYGRIEAKYGLDFAVIMRCAFIADGFSDDADDRNVWWNASPAYLESFGHYLAMQAMGHGVSWFDDHPKFTVPSRASLARVQFVVPYFENPLVGAEASSAS